MANIIRIEVSGFVNKSWEGSDAQADKFLRELRDLQLKMAKSYAGEQTVKNLIRGCYKRGEAPEEVANFPLRIEINGGKADDRQPPEEEITAPEPERIPLQTAPKYGSVHSSFII